MDLDPRFAPLAGAYVLLLALAAPLGMRLLDVRSDRQSGERRRTPSPGSSPSARAVSRP